MDKIDNILDRLQQMQQPAVDAPDELTDRIMNSLRERGRGRRRPQAHRKWIYAAAYIAASLLLLIGVGIATMQKESPTKDLIAVASQKQGHTPKTVAEKSLQETHTPVVEIHTAQPLPAPAREAAAHSGVTGAKPIYTAYTETKDTVEYLPPARVDEFIGKLANYHHVETTVLSDSTARSVAYVFPDNNKVRLFDRLLQVASSYSYDSPGYQMTISQQQILFTLEDTRLSRRYLWLAERIGGGRIILYAIHAPTGVAVSSEAYQEFRERTTHTNQTTEL